MLPLNGEFLAFANKLDNTENRVRYPEDKLMIG